MNINKSPERNTFQKQAYIERMQSEGKDVDPAIVEMYEMWAERADAQVIDPEWQKDNMEYDLRSTNWICDKVKESKVYAQNLYAAMCNRDFQKLDVIPILKDQRWSCSWRHGGGIVADMREEGDYIDWYCSGIREQTPMEQEEWNLLTYEQQVAYKEGQAYVAEGMVTDEIRGDLNKLGWAVLDDE